MSPNGMFGVPDLESMAGSKTEPMMTHVVNDRPRNIPLSPNEMFGVPDRESMVANQNP